MGTGIFDLLYHAALVAGDFYIDHVAALDGVLYWDTGVFGLEKLGDWGIRVSDPFNDHEFVDSSVAVIVAQGFLRLVCVAYARGGNGSWYEQVGLRVLYTLIDDGGSYLSWDFMHQGLLLYLVYHWLNGWDYVLVGSRVLCGESSMWGDYHVREVVLLVKRLVEGEPHLMFFGGR